MTYNCTFILPTLNESRHIGGVLKSIHKYGACLNAYEIVVVDNGSKDETVSIAEKNGARVYCKPGVNVGALRNSGAAEARFDYLVFLDADVYLTSDWQDRILHVLDSLRANPNAISGSTCGISENPGIIESCWWGGPKKTQVNYINSGHMIVGRSTFYELGGFDESLKTGEDSEFCRRLRDVEVKIYHDPALSVIHEGYPKSWYQFFRRERWHGLGDYSSLSIFMRSKPALVSTFQAFLLIIALSIWLATGNWLWLFIYPAFILPLCAFAAWRRANSSLKCLLINTGLFLTYFWARAFALADALYKRSYARSR